MNSNLVITIGRTFGSGGRDIGNVNTDGLEHSARSFRADLPLV